MPSLSLTLRLRARFSAGFIAALAVATLIAAGSLTASAQAVTCPNANTVIQENACSGPGDSGYLLHNPSENIAGYATQTSFDLGQSVPLKIARNQPTFPASTVDIAVYRTGYYGGKGGRLIAAASQTGVTVNNDFTCNPMDTTTGFYDCSNWNVTYTIPGSALPASGVYIAKLTTTDTGEENHIVFVVRDDARQSKAVVVLPTASWQAYNNFGGKSLYFDRNGGTVTIAGTTRAVKVSFNRPLDRPDAGRNRYLGPDSELVSWLEKQGYDVTYSDDVAVDADPASLKLHKVAMVSGHSEYWSAGEMHGFKAARDAGVNIASFSGNTAYWKIRYEDGRRTLVCYKTVEGSGSAGSGRVTPNDPGPDGVAGTADDAVGLDGVAGTADDHPENATTTWRDNGAPPGDPEAPAAGRVGPDEPENSLLGNMYVGDHDSTTWGLTVPASDGNGQFAGNRIWRNTGLSTNASTTLGTNLVGWEWDQVPTQAQYLAQQPSGVKKVTQTEIVSTSASWLQDEGRKRNTVPPPGQPDDVSAVTYTAASGARVFSTGTMYWSLGFGIAEVAQATYNVLSDMGIQPGTPTGVTLDPQGSNQAPTAAFTVSPTDPKPNVAATFDGSGSSDSDGTIAKYEWDFDGNGTYEVDSGTSSTVSHTYTAEGTFDVHLKVTDNGGATDFTTRTITVIGNHPPTAAITASPTTAVVTQDVTLSATGSADSDGSIVKYEWDLDGNGTFESDTGATATAHTTFASVGTYVVSVRVTDDGGKTATDSVPITVNSGGLSNYGDAVLDTAGLQHYWRMGEGSGPTLADGKGGVDATVSGGTFGVPGGPADDPNTAVSFNGSSDYGTAALDLSGNSVITLEFWLKWSAYANDDRLAMEFTPNFNNQPGGFIVDPDAPQYGGTFGVGYGVSGTRNTAFFARPSANTWHHYAIVIDTAASAANRITPYVDGQAVSYQKSDSGTGGSLANSTLYLMSRAGSSLFGAGGLDELAIYDRALSASTIADHAASYGTNRRPVAAISGPSTVRLGQTITFDGSGSSDPDGSITKYQWDLDGNGTYETNTGTTPTVSTSYSTEQQVTVGLKVTDDRYADDVATKTIFAGNAPPVASVTATPNPAIADQQITLDASASNDPDGSIAKYEWDLDGNGTYGTDTGTTPTTTRTYSAAGTYTVGVRVTDNEGKTSTTTIPLTVNSNGVSNYGDTVLDTAGLDHYWRMGETNGPTAADSAGTAHAAIAGGTFAVPGGVANDPNTAIRFNGTTDSGSAPVDLSGTSVVTLEFWLKWKSYANDDKLAMELTPNFNNQPGGFLVDPNANQEGGKFGIGIGVGNSRNNVYFDRPSAGAWHHYAVVMDMGAPGSTQITPYVDGKAVTYTKTASGAVTNAKFANSSLYFMSRAGSTLFGAGDLDEVAIYHRALSASTIADHYAANGTNRRPVATLSGPSTVKPGATATFSAAGSSDPDGTITDYQWDLDGNGTYETHTGTTPSVSKTYTSEQELDVSLRVLDDRNGTDSDTKHVSVADVAPTASFTASPVAPHINDTVTFDASASGDPDGSIATYQWDFDGDGTYDRTTTSATTTTSYGTVGSRTVKLRVTDDGGKTATTTQAVSVKSATYASVVGSTSGLLHYWRMGDATGSSVFTSSFGGIDASLTNVTLGVAGALFGDSDTAGRFSGSASYARANINLSAESTITIELWLKWNAYASDDRLAMELTANFNNYPGGFIVDPNSGTRFAVSIGYGTARNTVAFTRPTAGAWHHYVFVLDTSQPAATQITPYVDGQAVSYTKPSSGTTTGKFANAPLYFMSRGGTTLFGPGDLDEVAIYHGALSAAQIQAHYAAGTP